MTTYAYRLPLIASWVACATAGASAQAAEETVGQPPPEEAQQQVVAVFTERGVLTPQGRFVVEPSIEYVHARANQIDVEGFTILPAILVGVIEISELQRDTLVGAVTARYGATDRLELEAKVPYVYRSEDVREREVFEGEGPLAGVADSSGSGLGDVEAAVHYQLNAGRGGWPIFIANLRGKTRTGTDPFEVDSDLIETEGGEVIGQIFREQPTGSGFWAVEPSLTAIYPTDPAVLFANLSYWWNIERDLGGEVGRIDPGDSLGFGFGMGFAVNDTTSFSLGYDHSIVFETERENEMLLQSEFDQIHVGTLLFGLSQRITKSTSANLSVGVGVTEDAADVQLRLRVPFSF